MTGWEGSNRRAELPADWPARREAVIRRAGGVCQWPDGAGTGICGIPGNQVDHIVRGHNHDLSNLQLLCEAHHNRKSAAEGGNAYIPLRRPPERHPALG